MNKLFSAMVVVFSMGMTGSLYAQDCEKEKQAYNAADYATSVKKLKLLAECGDADAQHEIGSMYYFGKGVIEDFKEAAVWYRKAAEQGEVRSQTMFGGMYDLGYGVTQNNIYAHMWWNIAASNGDEAASFLRGDIAGRMTAAEITQAQELARECVKKQYKGC